MDGVSEVEDLVDQLICKKVDLYLFYPVPTFWDLGKSLGMTWCVVMITQLCCAMCSHMWLMAHRCGSSEGGRHFGGPRPEGKICLWYFVTATLLQKGAQKEHWLKLYMIVYAYDFYSKLDMILSTTTAIRGSGSFILWSWDDTWDMTLDKEELSWLTVAGKFRRIVLWKFMRCWRIRRANTLVMIIFHICDLDNDTDERMIIIMMVMMVVVMMPSHGYYLNSWDSWGEDLLSLHRWRNGRGLRKRMGWTRWTVKHHVSPDGVMPPCFFSVDNYIVTPESLGPLDNIGQQHGPVTL